MTAPESLFYLIRGQVPYMEERGIHVYGIASPGRFLTQFSEENRVDVHAVRMSREISPLADIRSVWQLWRIFRRIRPDIVQSGTPKGGLLGMIAAWISCVPVRIYTIRGLPLETATGARRRLLWLTEWISCRLADRVICVGPSLREMAIAERICPSNKIVTLANGSGNGVDAMHRFNPERIPNGLRNELRQRFDIPLDATVIGFVGRLTRIKGVVELMEAWESLKTLYPDLHLLMVGPTEVHDPLPDSVMEAMRNDPRMHLTGPQEDTAPFYAAMDVFILPTYREGVPNVVLEASAMQLPIISTLVSGPIDIIRDGISGTLVPPRDSSALIEATMNYMSCPTVRQEHATLARRRVLDDFRQELIWEALFQEYRELLEAKDAAWVAT